jgi:hypothetical protein
MSEVQHIRAAVSELRNAIVSGTSEMHAILRQRDIVRGEVRRLHNNGTPNPSIEQQLKTLDVQAKHSEQVIHNLQSIVHNLSVFR